MTLDECVIDRPGFALADQLREGTEKALRTVVLIFVK
jgi:hypothetical protein